MYVGLVLAVDVNVSWSAMERLRVLEIGLGYENAEMSSGELVIKC